MKFLRRALVVLLVLLTCGAAAWWFVLPRVAAARAKEALESVWRGPVVVGAMHGVFGTTLTLTDVEFLDPVDGESIVILLDSIEARFDDRMAAGGILEHVSVEGVRCDVKLSEPIRRATLETFLDLRGIEIESLPYTASLRDCDVRISFEDGIDGFELEITNLSVDLERDGRKVDIRDAGATISGGAFDGFGEAVLGEVDDFFLQAKLAGADLATLVEGTELERTATRGQLDAFIELRGVSEGPGRPFVGAGWIDARQAHVWDVPVFSGLLDAVGLLADAGDYLRHARARFRIDRQEVGFSHLMAIGSPVSLYGNGRMDLDGTDLEADLVPRFGSGLLSDLPVIGDPTQALLDLTKGVLLEVRLRGALTAPRIETLPLPIVTAPIQEFIDLVSGDGDEEEGEESEEERSR